MTQKELLNEVDMLKGNINRMMVTDDIKELYKMYECALKRINTIYLERVDSFLESVPNSSYWKE